MIKTCYAVAVGHKNHVIVDTWEECAGLVNGYSGARFKGFRWHHQAETWLGAQPKPAPDDSLPVIVQPGFIPATNKRDKYGYYKPRYYTEGGVRHADYGRTIGALYDSAGIDLDSSVPWDL